MFSFRFVGLFLFRFEERSLLGSLLKEPPRNTRLDEGKIGLAERLFHIQRPQPTPNLTAGAIGQVQREEQLIVGQCMSGGGQS